MRRLQKLRHVTILPFYSNKRSHLNQWLDLEIIWSLEQALKYLSAICWPDPWSKTKTQQTTKVNVKVQLINRLLNVVCES